MALSASGLLLSNGMREECLASGHTVSARQRYIYYIHVYIDTYIYTLCACIRSYTKVLTYASSCIDYCRKGRPRAKKHNQLVTDIQLTHSTACYSCICIICAYISIYGGRQTIHTSVHPLSCNRRSNKGRSRPPRLVLHSMRPRGGRLEAPDRGLSANVTNTLP